MALTDVMALALTAVSPARTYEQVGGPAKSEYDVSCTAVYRPKGGNHLSAAQAQHVC